MLQVQTKVYEVFLALRAAIVEGRLAPGDRIRAGAWADLFGTSHIPVREALQRLEAEGLVVIEPHRGARVIAPTPEDVVETYLMRTALESLAAKVALERLTDDNFNVLLRELEGLTEKMAGAGASGDVPLLRQSHRRLHMTLYRAGGLPRLAALIESLWAVYPFRSLNPAPQRIERGLRDHQRLLEALRTRDATAVSKEIEEHLRSTQQALLQDLKNPSSDRNVFYA